MRQPSPRFMVVWLATVIAILIASAVEGIYHAGWMDGFHKCARIYEEASR